MKHFITVPETQICSTVQGNSRNLKEQSRGSREGTVVSRLTLEPMPCPELLPLPQRLLPHTDALEVTQSAATFRRTEAWEEMAFHLHDHPGTGPESNPLGLLSLHHLEAEG